MHVLHGTPKGCHSDAHVPWYKQHKPYIVELSFMETQKSHDAINEGPSLITEGPPQTNVTCTNHQTEFKSDFSLSLSSILYLGKPIPTCIPLCSDSSF